MSDAAPDDRRNVVLVTVDSLRADHCSYWGYDRKTTPTLDRMAREGFVCEQAIAPGPSTYESMPAIFTGQHMTSFHPEVRRRTSGDSEADALDARIRNIDLNMSTPTIAEWFADRGYTTGAFTTNPYTGSNTAFARGFDYYEDFMGDGEGPLMRRAAHIPVLSELKHVVTLVRGDRASKQWTEYYDRIVEWTQTVEQPYFLWVFLLDTHTPYLAGKPARSDVKWSRGRSKTYYHNWRLWLAKKWRNAGDGSALDREALVDLYDTTVRSVDNFIGRLFADLDGTDPAVVVHADHGEAFGEHGSFGHDAQLYEENLRVPLVAYNAALTGASKVSVSLAELPALLRAVATDESTLSDGFVPEPALSKTYTGEKFSLRGIDWKYVCRTNPEAGTIRNDAVYDLEADPGERSPSRETTTLVTACRDTVRRRLRHERELNRIVAGTVDVRQEGWT